METFVIILFLIFLATLYYAIKVSVNGLLKPFDVTRYREYVQKNVKPIKTNPPRIKVYKNKYHTLKGNRHQKM